MSKFIVQNGNLVGIATSDEVGLPNGFSLVDAPEGATPEGYYFDGSEAVKKPAKPSERHYWDNSDRAWKLMPLPASPVVNQEDWKGLENDLRGTDVFGKLYQAITQPESNTVAALTKMMKANATYTLLMNTITATHALVDLEFAIADLRNTLKTIGTVGDFSADQLAFINQCLETRGFSLRLEP